ncbi:pantoate-beta-alanine ligase [Schizosaccharomyces cryophilus OY26]|uniref:Pantoate--beta-alanine ligase n=1 Tax=Schizosaccharomyces cryophilus (strain OY26 / ATCC MYA-4695 / CBS 11777 / NBRC 106824 / NRRL Y48691) TaxID=653667 RepID=S9W416_SCHCR|nr:pantoate-beta-alanine ligase [Schizosaccharomyces cryophilus OY26]EPY52705.1 pantoate-beta-alanine ligase [Schizosaccharomyces cryophilus OY26]
MIIEGKKDLVRKQVQFWRQQGERIAFVPTMGNLHEGHLTLVKRAKELGTKVAVSIFVNPMQFNNQQDLDAYPHTLEDDYEKLKEFSVDLVFTPTAQELYPTGSAGITFVETPKLSEMLEGASRPGHFRGVTTIVSKLFHIIQPDVACFGEKDFQQLAIIRKMVTDLDFGIEIVGVPTVRCDNGLALSSRNGYLTEEQRRVAPDLYKILSAMVRKVTQGQRDFATLLQESNTEMRKLGFLPDQIEIRDADTLESCNHETKRMVLLAAAWLGKARLIDNIQINCPYDNEIK